jgi:hypothetical protein
MLLAYQNGISNAERQRKDSSQCGEFLVASAAAPAA